MGLCGSKERVIPLVRTLEELIALNNTMYEELTRRTTRDSNAAVTVDTSTAESTEYAYE